jgi:hypothetical protein
MSDDSRDRDRAENDAAVIPSVLAARSHFRASTRILNWATGLSWNQRQLPDITPYHECTHGLLPDLSQSTTVTEIDGYRVSYRPANQSRACT